MHFILIKSVFNDHLFCMTLFQCALGRSHKTGLAVCFRYEILLINFALKSMSNSNGYAWPSQPIIFFISQMPIVNWSITRHTRELYTCCFLLPFKCQIRRIELGVMVLNATFNNISVILWRTV